MRLIEFLPDAWMADMTGAELRDWRAKTALTQADLAGLLSVDHMTISRWERGLREIPSFLHLALKELERRHGLMARR